MKCLCTLDLQDENVASAKHNAKVISFLENSSALLDVDYATHDFKKGYYILRVQIIFEIYPLKTFRLCHML